MAEERTNVDGAAGLLGDFAESLLGEGAENEGDGEAHGEAELEENELEAAGDEAEEETEESEEEETEDEAEGELEEEEYEEEGEAEAEDQLYPVRVDGKDELKTLAELTAGYSRTADYTRKTQAVANDRKALEQREAAGREQRDEYGARLEFLKKTLADQLPDEPDPRVDPTGWAVHQQQKDQLKAVEDEQARLHTVLQQEYKAEADAALDREAELLRNAIPEWKDDKVRQKDQKSMVSYLIGMGFDETTLDGLTDHKAVLILRDAVLYQELQDGRKKVKGKVAASKTLRPSAPKPRKTGKRKSLDRAAQRLSETGRERDAASLIEQLMGEDD
jgi:hypothetical protein